MSDPIHPARPQAPTPATKPGQIPSTPAVPLAPAPPSADARDDTPHSPKRDGDNAGGESTASEQRTSDKGHQRAPRPGEHQGGH